MIRFWPYALLAALPVGCLVPSVGSAQNITTDGSLGAKVTLAGPSYPITADLGKQVGGNLFHSFGVFGLNKGESATFSGPATVTNVIGRVTGGTASSINGKIDSSSLAGANLYLINPSGIVFGPNATVNVSGSFHASTADYVRLSDGAKFQATNASGSTLTASAPAAFGFLNASPPAITVDGSQLGVTTTGATLGVVVGPVTIKNSAALTAPAGTIRVTGVAGTGEAPVDPVNSAALTVTSFGPVSIVGGSKLDVSDPMGLGSASGVHIRAGTLTIDASGINGSSIGSGDAGSVTVAAQDINLLAGAVISSNASCTASSGCGNGGNVTVSSSGKLSLDSTGVEGAVPSNISAVSSGSGNAGSITVSAQTVSLVAGSFIASGAGCKAASGCGSGGAVSIQASGDIVLDSTGSSLVSTISAGTQGSGTAGSVSVRGQNISLLAGSVISSNAGCTAGSGCGNGGNVMVSAAGKLVLDSTGLAGPVPSNISAVSSGSGNAGSVTVAAQTVSLLAGSFIASGAGCKADAGCGNGGSIDVTAGGDIVLDSTGSSLVSTISAGTQGPGAAGSVSVRGQNISLLGGSVISSNTDCTAGSGCGNGGNTVVSASGKLILESTGLVAPVPSNISAVSSGSGNAGSVTVEAQAVRLLAGSFIASGAGCSADAGCGNGGAINVTASGDVVLDSAGSSKISTINAGSLGSGAGGSVSVDA